MLDLPPRGTPLSAMPPPELHLDPSQQAAVAVVLDRVVRQRVTVLTGPAGTGKTTTLRALLPLLRDRFARVTFAAPTGKAALRMSEVLHEKAHTLHSLIYGMVTEDEQGEPVFAEPGAAVEEGSLLVVDEGSMVGSRLAADLLDFLPDTARVLVLADPAQLPPVRDSWGFPILNPDAQLTQVHRQAGGSPVLDYATAIREGNGAAWLRSYDRSDPRLKVAVVGSYTDAVQVMAGFVAADGTTDAVALAYTNRATDDINAAVRAALGHTFPVMPGDRLLVLSNQTRMNALNGEIVDVHQIHETRTVPNSPLRAFRGTVMLRDDDHALKPRIAEIVPAAFGYSTSEWRALTDLADFGPAKPGGNPFQRSRRKRATADGWRGLHCRYGFAITTHKSQGSQWARVAVLLDGDFLRLWQRDRDTATRLLYTAVTRTSGDLLVVAIG